MEDPVGEDLEQGVEVGPRTRVEHLIVPQVFEAGGQENKATTNEGEIKRDINILSFLYYQDKITMINTKREHGRENEDISNSHVTFNLLKAETNTQYHRERKKE